jgi:hypothetical protein
VHDRLLTYYDCNRAAQLVDGAADLRLGELRFQERESSPSLDAATARNEHLAPLAMDLPMKACFSLHCMSLCCCRLLLAVLVLRHARQNQGQRCS